MRCIAAEPNTFQSTMLLLTRIAVLLYLTSDELAGPPTVLPENGVNLLSSRFVMQITRCAFVLAPAVAVVGPVNLKGSSIG